MNPGMPSISQLNLWRLIVAAALGAVAYASFHSSGGDSARDPGSSPVQSARYATGLGPANIPLPQGGWGATGRVAWVSPNAMTNQPPGTVLKRPWDFHKVCRGTCKIVFSRWTLYGPSATWLVKHGRFFTARFPPVRVPCSYPRGSSYPHRLFGQSHDYYKLWWSSDGSQIRATEHRTQTGCYRTPDPPDVTRWQATRATRRTPAAGALS
jgi:hypothetical protein